MNGNKMFVRKASDNGDTLPSRVPLVFFNDTSISLKVHFKYPKAIDRVVNKDYIRKNDIFDNDVSFFTTIGAKVAKAKPQKVVAGRSRLRVRSFATTNATPYPGRFLRNLSNTYKAKNNERKSMDSITPKEPHSILLTRNQVRLVKHTLQAKDHMNQVPNYFDREDIITKSSRYCNLSSGLKFRDDYHFMCSTFHKALVNKRMNSYYLVNAIKSKGALKNGPKSLVDDWQPSIASNNTSEKGIAIPETVKPGVITPTSVEILAGKDTEKHCQNILQSETFDAVKAYNGKMFIGKEIMKLFNVPDSLDMHGWMAPLLQSEDSSSQYVPPLSSSDNSGGDIDTLAEDSFSKNITKQQLPSSISSFEKVSGLSSHNSWIKSRNRRGKKIFKKIIRRHKSISAFSEQVQEQSRQMKNSKEKVTLSNETEANLQMVWLETKPGNTLAIIAKKYCVDPNTIIELNQSVLPEDVSLHETLFTHLLIKLRVKKKFLSKLVQTELLPKPHTRRRNFLKTGSKSIHRY